MHLLNYKAVSIPEMHMLGFTSHRQPDNLVNLATVSFDLKAVWVLHSMMQHWSLVFLLPPYRWSVLRRTV